MDGKLCAASLGLGMLTGAAVVLMLPKHSEAYRMADSAAKTVKMEVGKLVDSMKKE